MATALMAARNQCNLQQNQVKLQKADRRVVSLVSHVFCLIARVGTQFDAVKKVNNFMNDEITFNNGVITRVLCSIQTGEIWFVTSN